MTVLFTGDWMPTGGRAIRFGEELLRFFAPADLVVANFEGVSVQPGRSVVMQQVHGKETLDALTSLSVPNRIVLSCANNHAADHGYKVFAAHFDYLESLGFQVVGSSDRPVVQPLPGVRLAALTQWSNHSGPYLASLEMAAAIGDARDFNVLYPHWGFELELFPRPEMVELARHLLSRWDMIMGHHSHTPAPVAGLGPAGVRRPVAFSLGNFVSSSRMRKNRWGIVCRAFLGRNLAGHRVLRQLEWRFSTVEFHGRDLVVNLADRCPYFPHLPRP